jgi:hypothetical protein
MLGVKFVPGVVLPEDTGPNPRSERYFARLLENRDDAPDNYSSLALGMVNIRLSLHLSNI